MPTTSSSRTLQERPSASPVAPGIDTDLCAARASQHNGCPDGKGSKGVVCYAGCGPDILRLRNDVVAAWHALEADAPLDEAHDIFSGGVTGVRLRRGSIVADPRFRNPRAGDFRLLPSSPAVDRGVRPGYTRDLSGTRLPLAGKAPDAGCYEFRSSG